MDYKEAYEKEHLKNADLAARIGQSDKKTECQIAAVPKACLQNWITRSGSARQ